MATLEIPTENFDALTLESEALLEIQLSVARRADELSRRFGTSRETDRRLWLRAECEVFERTEIASAPCS